MTLRLEIRPEVEATLAARARMRGLSLDAYLRGVVEDLAMSPDDRAANLQELKDTLDALAELGKNLPALPSSAYRREALYDDRE